MYTTWQTHHVPLAENRHGGRFVSRAPHDPSGSKGTLDRSRIHLAAGELRTTPLYTQGNSLRIRTTAMPDADSGLAPDPLPLYTRGRWDTDVNASSSAPRMGPTRWTRSESEGVICPGGLRASPKEMRILPLRSSVQMGSDVSLGSSVTPDRSAIVVTERGPI